MINDVIRVDWIIQGEKMLCEKCSEQNLEKANVQKMNKKTLNEKPDNRKTRSFSLKHCKIYSLLVR